MSDQTAGSYVREASGSRTAWLGPTNPRNSIPRVKPRAGSFLTGERLFVIGFKILPDIRPATAYRYYA
jgi:hypothetical protein